MISLLWPWDDAPPESLPPGVAIARGATHGSIAARFRELGRTAPGDVLCLPAGPTGADIDEALALVPRLDDGVLATPFPRSFFASEPVAVLRSAWERVAGALGEHEPHRGLALTLEAWRSGAVVRLVSGAATAAPGPPSADDALEAMLDLLGELPQPLRGKLLSLAIFEMLGRAAASNPGLAARFGFGEPPAEGHLLDEPSIEMLVSLEERARSARATPPFPVPPMDRPGRLVPRLGLGNEERASLEEILGLVAAPGEDPRPETAPRVQGDRPGASIVIPTLDGASLLKGCLESIGATTPHGDRLEVVVVDNGSRDETKEVVASFSNARLVALDRNEGFAGPCNKGAREARSDVLIFLNNDTQVQPGWIEGLLLALEKKGAACSLVLSENGRTVDFGGGGVNFEGKGFQQGYGDDDLAAYAAPRATLFGNGASFAIRRDLWERAGGFDESFFAYYEDVDLGLRLALMGEEIELVPASRVLHRHNATSRRFPERQKSFHMERNALLSVLKVYEPDTLAALLPAALFCMVLRASARADFELHAAALFDVTRSLPAIARRRRRAQKERAVPDEKVLALVASAGHAQSPAPTPDPEGYRAAQASVLTAFGVPRLFASRVRRKVLFVTHEDLTENLAGPAIRVLELAAVLGRHHDVAVAAPKVARATTGIALCEYDRWEEPSLLRLAAGYDVLVVQGHTLQRYTGLKKLGKAIVCDLYCPFPLENLELFRGGDVEKSVGSFEGDIDALDAKLVWGDYFLAASEKQKDLWLGALLAQGRVNPFTYGEDPTLDSLIGVVPFGIPSEPPTRAGAGLKGTFPGIGKDDKVLLWGGSLVQWQDPLTVIRALARIVATRDDVKLLFMGVIHPTPGVKPMPVVERARDLAASLGLLDRHVFFHGWVPYHERGAVLLDSDVAVLAHRIHAETRFSFRTRMLDCIWAELPIVVTEGDTFAELVRSEGLGITVGPNDPQGFAAAVLALLSDEQRAGKARKGLRRLQDRMAWDVVAAPLLARLSNLDHAADFTYQRQRGWRRALMKLGGGSLLDSARKSLPQPVRKTLKRLLRMGR